MSRLVLMAWLCLLSLGCWSVHAAEPPRVPAWERKLSAQQQTQVEKLEQQSAAAAQKESWGPARTALQEVVKIRTTSQGDRHWQTLDAQRAEQGLALLQQLKLPEQKTYLLARARFTEAEKLLEQGKPAEARRRYQDAASLWTKLLPAGHVELTRCSDGIGKSYVDERDWPAAIKMLSEARAGYAKDLGALHPDYGYCCGQLSFALERSGDRDRALPILQEALQTIEDAKGPLHVDTAILCRRCAYNLDRPGRYTEAEPYFRRCVQLAVAHQQGRETRDSADRRRELARNLADQGKYEAAAEEYGAALKVLVDVVGEIDRDTIMLLREFAELELNRRHNAAAAEKLSQRALKARRTLGLPDDEVLALLEAELAQALTAQERHAAALPHYQVAAKIMAAVFGTEHIRTAKFLNAAGDCLHKLQRFAEAKPLLERAVAIGKVADDPALPRLPLYLLDLAQNNEQLVGPAAAEPVYRAALAAAQQAFVEDEFQSWMFYTSLELNLRRQFKHEQADEISQSLERRLLTDDPATNTFSRNLARAVAIGTLATNLENQGRFDESLPLRKKHFELWRELRGPDDGLTRSAQFSIAFCLNGQGRYAEAITVRQAMLAADVALKGPTSQEVMQDLMFLSNDALQAGNFPLAERFAKEFLACTQQLNPPDEWLPLHAQSLLAIIFHRQNKTEEAVNLSRQVVEQRERLLAQKVPGEDIGDLLLVLQRILGNEQAVIDGAHARVRDALVRFAKDSPYIASTYDSLSDVLQRNARYEEAQNASQEALRISQLRLGDSHPDTVRRLARLGRNEYAQGKLAQAEEHWTAAADHYAQAKLRLSPSGLERARFTAENVPFDWLAALVARRGDARAAAQRLEDGLALGLHDELTSRDRVLSAADRGRELVLQRQIRDLDERRERVETALSAAPADAELLAARQQIKADERDIDRQWAALQIELGERYGAAAGKSLSIAEIQKTLRPQEAIVAWLDPTTAEKSADPDGEHWGCVIRSAGEPTWVRLKGTAANGQWDADDLELPSQLRLQLADSQPSNARAADVLELAAELAAQRIEPLEVALQAAKDLPAATHLIVLTSPHLDGIPIQLVSPTRTVSHAPSGTILAERRRRPPATVKPPSGLLVVANPVLPQPARSPLAEMAEDQFPRRGVLIQRVLEASNAAGAGLKPGDVIVKYGGAELQQPSELPALIGRLAEERKRDPKVPANVPLTVWRWGKQVELTAQRGPLGIAFATTSAAAALRAWQRIDRTLGQVTELQNLQPLPGSAAEAESLSRLFAQAGQPATSLAGSQATEEQLQDLRASGDLAGYRFVHFASHAVIDSRAPMQSRLVLSGAQALTAGQIQREWKLSADLVVLSACQSALGEQLGGEGYLGFTQAFLLAGTPSIVASLWPVEDSATSLLMVRFYENLLGKREGLKAPLSKAAALHESQTWLRNLSAADAGRLVKTPLPAGDKPFAHPAYWSAFILIGEP